MFLGFLFRDLSTNWHHLSSFVACSNRADVSCTERLSTATEAKSYQELLDDPRHIAKRAARFGSCQDALSSYATAGSKFVECSVNYSRPILLCEKCVDEYLHAQAAFTDYAEVRLGWSVDWLIDWLIDWFVDFVFVVLSVALIPPQSVIDQRWKWSQLWRYCIWEWFDWSGPSCESVHRELVERFALCLYVYAKSSFLPLFRQSLLHVWFFQHFILFSNRRLLQLLHHPPRNSHLPVFRKFNHFYPEAHQPHKLFRWCRRYRGKSTRKTFPSNTVSPLLFDKTLALIVLLASILSL